MRFRLDTFTRIIWWFSVIQIVEIKHCPYSRLHCLPIFYKIKVEGLAMWLGRRFPLFQSLQIFTRVFRHRSRLLHFLGTYMSFPIGPSPWQSAPHIISSFRCWNIKEKYPTSDSANNDLHGLQTAGLRALLQPPRHLSFLARRALPDVTLKSNPRYPPLLPSSSPKKQNLNFPSHPPFPSSLSQSPCQYFQPASLLTCQSFDPLILI